MCSTVCRASAGVVSSQRTTNSSPPSRATTSLRRRAMVLRRRRDLDQDAVADGVTVLVVDRFEAVQVEEDHGAGLAVAVMAGDGDLDPGQDLRAVGEAR